MAVRLQTAPFAPGAELDAFTAGQTGAGAIVSFTGIVRDVPGGGLQAMEIEQYPGMTRAALEKIDAQAAVRWALAGSLVLHRHGHLTLGEPIMMVATASAHRQDAFAAAEFLMDYLKSRAPFWKKEITAGGGAWVDAREIDEAALRRWDD